MLDMVEAESPEPCELGADDPKSGADERGEEDTAKYSVLDNDTVNDA